MSRMLTVGAVFALLAMATCATAHAAGFATDSRGRIYRIVPGKKEATLVGTVRVSSGAITPGGASYTPSLTDLALSPKKGMYGISFGELYKINMENPAQSTLVGSLGVTCNALAFDEEHNLWATGGSSLYRVDLLKGRATLVGSFGIGLSDGDLAFVGKTLYGTLSSSRGSVLVTMDVKTGKATAVGVMRDTQAKALFDVWGLIWDGQRMYALTRDGRVFGLDVKKAIATPIFAVRRTFWGACPMPRM